VIAYPSAPLIRYNPGSGVRDILFPWPVQHAEIRRFGAFTLHWSRGPGIVIVEATTGGAVSREPISIYDQIVIYVPGYPEDTPEVAAFNDEMVAFWSWAGAGGHFTFLMDPVSAVLRVLDSPAPATANAISTDDVNAIGTPVTDSKTAYRLLNLTTGISEDVTFNGVGVGLGDYTIGGRVTELTYGYNVGDVLTDSDSYGVMITRQKVEPVRRIPSNLFSFALSMKQSVGHDQPGGGATS
jgi:hypothetical protein